MSKIKLYNALGEVVGEENLDPRVFGCAVKGSVVHQVMVAMEANARENLAHTKTRGEVRGGGRKPWRQKGTGRARHGSNRSPIWIGGGVTFGPRNERNFKQKINKKMKQKAYFMCLSDKVENDNLIILDKLELNEIKTKNALEVLKKLPVKKSVLVAIPEKNEKIEKSMANIPKVGVELVSNLNVLDILRYESIVMPKESIKKIEATYSKKQ